MTGQVDFDSHTSEIVVATADVINLITPHQVSGKDYHPPEGADLVLALETALSADDMDTATPDELTRFDDYVRALRGVFELVDGGAGDLGAACELTNGILRETGAIPVLASHNGKPWHLHFHPLDAGWARAWIGPMATGLAMVLGSDNWVRLGVCSAPSCDAVYVDTSRNGAKRFCGTTCQNRVKAAAFRERHRAASS